MNRRELLRNGGLVLAVGTTGLAGCESLPDVPGVGGGSGDFEDVGQWMPDPGAFDPTLEHYRVVAQSPSRLADVSDDALWEIVTSSTVDFENLTASQVDYVIQADVSTDVQRSYRVYVGSFDADWIGTTLERQDFGRGLSYKGFQMYEPTGQGQRAYAVTDNAIIHATHQPRGPSEEADPTRVIQTLVDTRREEADGYAAVNEDMEALAGILPVEHWVSVRTFDRVSRSDPEQGVFRNQVAQGISHLVNGEETDVSHGLVFRDEGDVVERDLETYIDESPQFRNYVARPEYQLSGRTVLIKGTVPTRVLDLSGISPSAN